MIALVIVMSLLSPLFFTLGNLLNTSRYFVEVGLMALGMTLIIITGGIDLSVGSNLALVSVAVGFTFAAGLPLPLPSCSASWSGWPPDSSTASS